MFNGTVLNAFRTVATMLYLDGRTNIVKLDTVKFLCELLYGCITFVLDCLNYWLNLSINHDIS